MLDTQAAQAVETPARPRLFTRVRNRVAAIAVSAAMLVAVPVAAQAAPGDPVDVGTIVQTQFTSFQTLLTTVLIPALFGLVLIGIGIALGIKYLRKGAKQA